MAKVSSCASVDWSSEFCPAIVASRSAANRTIKPSLIYQPLRPVCRPILAGISPQARGLPFYRRTALDKSALPSDHGQGQRYRQNQQSKPHHLLLSPVCRPILAGISPQARGLPFYRRTALDKSALPSDRCQGQRYHQNQQSKLHHLLLAPVCQPPLAEISP